MFDFHLVRIRRVWGDVWDLWFWDGTHARRYRDGGVWLLSQPFDPRRH